MSEPEITQVSQFHLVPSQQAVVTREGWRIVFNKIGEAPQISHNGQKYTLADGVMVPARVANDRPIDGAPAVLWHRTNGRLTENDIAKTICDDKDNPIGIYTGVWTPEWAKGQEIRTYAAITDARDRYGDLLCQSFNLYVAHLTNGEKLSDRPSHTPDVTYEMAMQAKIMGLKPGERTGHMIPTYELLRGQKYPGDKVTHRNNMYDLRHTGDFAKASNGGYYSRFVTEGGLYPSSDCYVSSTERRDTRGADVYGTVFKSGNSEYGHKGGYSWSLRPFIAELPQS